MSNWMVDLDLRVWVDADTPEEALDKVLGLVKHNPDMSVNQEHHWITVIGVWSKDAQ